MLCFATFDMQLQGTKYVQIFMRKRVIKEDWCLGKKDMSEFDSESQSGPGSLTWSVKLENNWDVNEL